MRPIKPNYRPTLHAKWNGEIDVFLEIVDFDAFIFASSNTECAAVDSSGNARRCTKGELSDFCVAEK